MDSSNTQSRVIANYFATTSGAGIDEKGTGNLLTGLQRRLGSWLDVEGKRVLDLGCGLGELCCLSKATGAASVTGVNLCQAEIEIAEKQVNGTFVLQDVADFLDGCTPGSYDRVFAMNILEHLDKDKLVRVVEGACRALCEGGSLVVMVPNATSPFGTMTRYWDITHFNAFTPSSLLQVSRLCGFGDNVEFRECGPVPHGLISATRYVLWQGIRLLIRLYLMIEVASSKGGIYTADMLVRLTKRGIKG